MKYLKVGVQELLQFLKKPMKQKHFSLLEIKTLKRHLPLLHSLAEKILLARKTH